MQTLNMRIVPESLKLLKTVGCLCAPGGLNAS